MQPGNSAPILLLRRISQRNLVAFRQSLGDHDTAGGRGADLDGHRLELPSALAVDELLPLLLEDGLARDGEGAGAILDIEHGPDAGARLHQRWVGVIERDRGAEVLHRYARETRAGQLVD